MNTVPDVWIIATVVAILAACACLAAMILSWSEANHERRRADELVDELRSLRAERRARTLDEHADDALALTSTVPDGRWWVTPSAAQLAQWAQRPGRDWQVGR